MPTILIGAAGLAIMIIAFCSLALTLKHGIFRARGHRLVSRRNHLVMFWANAAGIGILAGIGFGDTAIGSPDAADTRTGEANLAAPRDAPEYHWPG